MRLLFPDWHMASLAVEGYAGREFEVVCNRCRPPISIILEEVEAPTIG